LQKNAPPGDFHFEINKRFQLFAAKIPYATEEGIFRGVSGKIFQGTGNFHARSPDASILNFEQPQEPRPEFDIPNPSNPPKPREGEPLTT
jgi:hypothetical protein